MPATTGSDETRDIGSGGLRRVAFHDKTAAGLDHNRLREQVAPLLREIHMPATTGSDGTRDIGSGGLRRVALHNKAAASLGHSPREVPWRGAMALVAWWSAEHSATREVDSRSGREPRLPQAEGLQ
jgi:hypothetical protein